MSEPLSPVHSDRLSEQELQDIRDDARQALGLVDDFALWVSCPDHERRDTIRRLAAAIDGKLWSELSRLRSERVTLARLAVQLDDPETCALDAGGEMCARHVLREVLEEVSR